MKVFKYIFLFTFLFFGLTFKVYANNDYYFDQYDIDITVNKQNVLIVNGRLKAYFNVPKHGIFINLPLYNNVKREDGTGYQKRAKIYNIKVDEQFTVYDENKDKIIKIGDPEQTITGSKEYNFSYKYEIGADYSKAFDELYYNFIGTERDTSINHVNFKITMPQSFDATKLGFSVGSYGSVGYDESLKFQVNDNIITGSYNKPLDAYEGMTVRLELEEGYFEIKQFPSYLGYLTILILLFFIAYTYRLWYRYGKDEQIVAPINFYPPEGLNSAEIGYAYKGHAKSEHIVSLLIYLADQGYLEIHEEDKKKYRFVKIKEYDGDNQLVQTFFNELFSGRNEVTKDDLKESFYVTINLLKMKLSKSMNYIYEKSNTKAYLIIILFIFLTGLLVTIVPIVTSGGADIISTFMYLPPIYSINVGIGLITIVILIIFIVLLSKRSKIGQQLLNNISGFKKFLQTAEKSRIEVLIEQNPKYFYNIIPYAYVLGVSSMWIKKFADLAVEPPSWYVSSHPFDIIYFDRFLNDAINSTSQAMTSVPTSGGSGFSGGGFSGGGSGGGGMGSW